MKQLGVAAQEAQPWNWQALAMFARYLGVVLYLISSYMILVRLEPAPCRALEASSHPQTPTGPLREVCRAMISSLDAILQAEKDGPGPSRAKAPSTKNMRILEAVDLCSVFLEGS